MRIRLKLVISVCEGVEQLAVLRSITEEEALRRALQTGIRVYSGLELGGWVQLTDCHGDSVALRIMSEKPSWKDRLRKQTPSSPAYKEFEVEIDEQTVSLTRELASLWGFIQIDMFNRLTLIGAEVDTHFAQGGTAWLRDSESVSVGRIMPLE